MSVIEWSVGTWRIKVERSPADPLHLGRVYDQAAWRWNTIVRLLGYGTAYAQLLGTLARDGWLQDMGPGTRVLDAGIGSGALSLALARFMKGIPEIHGVDLSPRMLAKARATLARVRFRSSSVQLRYSDMDDLPFPDAHFDLVMSAHVLEHSPSPRMTVEEMARTLRPGAPLLIITTRANGTNALHGMRWRYQPIDGQKLLLLLEQVGLRDVRRYSLGRGRLSFPRLFSEAFIARKGSGCPGAAAGSEASM